MFANNGHSFFANNLVHEQVHAELHLTSERRVSEVGGKATTSERRNTNAFLK